MLSSSRFPRLHRELHVKRRTSECPWSKWWTTVGGWSSGRSSSQRLRRGRLESRSIEVSRRRRCDCCHRFLRPSPLRYRGLFHLLQVATKDGEEGLAWGYAERSATTVQFARRWRRRSRQPKYGNRIRIFPVEQSTAANSKTKARHYRGGKWNGSKRCWGRCTSSPSQPRPDVRRRSRGRALWPRERQLHCSVGHRHRLSLQRLSARWKISAKEETPWWTNAKYSVSEIEPQLWNLAQHTKNFDARWSERETASARSFGRAEWTEPEQSGQSCQFRQSTFSTSQQSWRSDVRKCGSVQQW